MHSHTTYTYSPRSHIHSKSTYNIVSYATHHRHTQQYNICSYTTYKHTHHIHAHPHTIHTYETYIQYTFIYHTQHAYAHTLSTHTTYSYLPCTYTVYTLTCMHTHNICINSHTQSYIFYSKLVTKSAFGPARSWCGRQEVKRTFWMWMFKSFSKGRQTIVVGEYAMRLEERRMTLAEGCGCKGTKATMIAQRGQ